MKWITMIFTQGLFYTLALSLLLFGSCSTTPTKDETTVVKPNPKQDKTTIVCIAGDTGSTKMSDSDKHLPWEELATHKHFDKKADKEILSYPQYAVAKAMLENGCELVWVPGDIIYEKGIPYKLFGKSISSKGWKLLEERFLHPYKPLTDKGIKFYLIAGNHDHYSKEEAWYEHLHQKFDFVHYPGRHWGANLGGICLVAFDPYRGVDREQFQEMLPDILGDIQDQDCLISFAMDHYPYFSPGSHGDADGGKKELMDNYILGKFDALITGHDHLLAYSGSTKGTHHILSGAGGKLRKIEKEPRVWAKAVYGYVKMTIVNNKAEVVYFDHLNKELFKTEINGQGIR